MAIEVWSRVRTAIRKAWIVIRLLTFSPREYFFERMNKYGVRNELLLVAVIGLMGFVGWGFAGRIVLEPFVTGAEAALPGTGGQTLPTDVHYRIWGVALFQSFGHILAIWIFYTVVIYAVSWIYSDRGSVFGLAKNLAWSLYPMFWAFLVMTIALIVTFWTVGEIETDLPISAEAAAVYLYDQGLNQPLVLAAMVATIPFIVWTGYLATFVVEKVRRLPRSQAIRVATVPVVLHIAYVLWGIAGRVGLA